jgi:hypothetical protein
MRGENSWFFRCSCFQGLCLLKAPTIVRASALTRTNRCNAPGLMALLAPGLNDIRNRIRAIHAGPKPGAGGSRTGIS